jgi:hypothetical protein
MPHLDPNGRKQMAKPITPLSAPVPTRRQLDELEALLQRMLELPVRHEQENALLISEPPELEAPVGERLSSISHEWEATGSDGTIDRDRHELPPHASLSASSDTDSRINSPRYSNELLPGTPAWDDETDRASEEPHFSAPEVMYESPNPGPIGDECVDQFTSELVRAEPGVFRILLGWLGLVCLLISLAILLLDWYGWTW